mgnify:CR=1 FL=1
MKHAASRGPDITTAVHDRSSSPEDHVGQVEIEVRRVREHGRPLNSKLDHFEIGDRKIGSPFS